MMKKLLSLVVAALLTVSAVATSASAAKFTDVDATNEALNDAVELLVALNVTTGTSDTTYGTSENVTRAQMATFIYRMMKAGKHAPTGGTNTTKFTDLDDPFYYFTIAWANETGIIKGRNDTTFDPKGGIILQDAYTMIVRALGYDDGTLSYPIGYITKAEELGLDANLDSKVNYDTTLTRGDVAIVLANMFYAETAEAYVQYVEVAEGVTRPEEFHYTLAEEVFGVEKVSQRVVATPSYGFGTNAPIKLDVEMIQLEKAPVDANEGTTIGDIDVIEFAELGLEGKADDYFLTDILMFVKENKGKYEILGATAQGTKKTVDFADIEFGKTNNKFNGILTIDGVKTYLGEAPYSYTKDSKNPTKYNPMFIEPGTGFKFADAGVDVSTSAKIEALVAGSKDIDFGYLARIYNDGLGEMDCIDSNGDGKYDYLFKKEYSVAKANTSATGVLAATPNYDSPLYTGKAIVAGVSFSNNDIVLAYVNTNANYVKVAEVINPVKGSMVLKTDTYFELDSGKKIYTNSPVKVAAAVANNDSMTAENLAPANFTTAVNWYFTANGTLVAKATVPSAPAAQFNTNENWAIVLESEAVLATTMIDGDVVQEYYLKVYNDGAIKSVKVATKDFSSVVDQLSIAKAEKDGYYTFELLTGGQSDKANYGPILKGTNTGVSAEYKVIGQDDVNFYQQSGNLFTLVDDTHLTSDLKGVRLTANTKILIRTKDANQKPVVTLYTLDKLPDIKVSEVFDNVTYVLTNNKNSTMYENIEMFYGEVKDGTLNGKDAELAEIRIVKSVATSETAKGTTYTFTLYNPFTGAEETANGVDGMTKAQKDALVANSIVCLDSDSLVAVGTAGSVNIAKNGTTYTASMGDMYDMDGDKSFADIIAGSDKLGLVSIDYFDKESGILEIAAEEPIVVTADTKISMLDISDKKISAITDASVLSSTTATYSWTGAASAGIKAFICTEDGEDFANALLVMIVKY